MSYYEKANYSFSHHALLRIKTRLNLEGYSEVDLKNHCLKLIQKSHERIMINDNEYIKINALNSYFVVDVKTNLVKTLTPMSPGKFLGLLNQE